MFPPRDNNCASYSISQRSVILRRIDSSQQGCRDSDSDPIPGENLDSDPTLGEILDSDSDPIIFN